MHLSILESNSNDFFKAALALEGSDPNGTWRYFKFINKALALGIFETESPLETSFEAHESFFKYFLGTFTPDIASEIKIDQLESFKDFCTKLNFLLNENVEIYDLSVNKKWIWSEGNEITVPKKLLTFVDFN